MKKILYSLLAAASLLLADSCSNNEGDVYVKLADNALVMTPAAGGAVLHYALPNDPDIVGIHVRYNDCYGDPILRTGSAYGDTLALVGFNEAQQNVNCDVTIQMRDGRESQPTHMTFNTLDSNPIQFINSVNVESGWNGFSINYQAPEDVQGLFHVYYLGTNPNTNVPDTILLETKNIAPGGDTIIYNPQQLKSKNTIIVKAEDYRGHIVKQRQWDVEAMETAKQDGIKIYYDNSYESDWQKTGLQYLTDGDLNGWRWFESKDDHAFYTFISYKNGCGEGSAPMYVDLGEKTPTASVRLYAYLFRGSGYGTCGEGVPCWGSTYCKYVDTNIVGQETNNNYYNRLPCDIDVYACRDNASVSGTKDFEGMKWEKIGSFSEDPTCTQDGYSIPDELWFNGCWDTRSYYSSDATADDVKALDPKYMSIDFMAAGQGEGFRFLKLVFNDCYRLNWEYANGTNTSMKVITFNELEVYTKKK